MPLSDISNAAISSALQQFVDFHQEMFGDKALGLATQFKKVLKDNVKNLEDMHKFGRLTERGFEELSEKLENLRKDKNLKGLLASMKEASEMTDKVTDSMSDMVKNITRFMPFFGDKMAEAFDKKLLPHLAKRLNVGFMKLFSTRSGAGGLSLFKIGLWTSIAAAAIGFGKLMMKVEAATAQMVRNTGFLRRDLQQVRTDVLRTWGASVKLGIGLDDVLETTEALAQQFGTLAGLNRKTIEQTTRWSKAFGISAQEAAQFTDVLQRSMSMTNEETDSFVHTLGGMARRHGVSFQMVMQDITRNTSFLAMYMTGTGRNIREAAIQARLLGTNISQSGSMLETFLDVETSITNTAEINNILQSNLNAMTLTRLADEGKIQEIESMIGVHLVRNQKRIQSSLMVRRQLSRLLGVDEETLLKMARLTAKVSEDIGDAAKGAKELNDKLREQMPFWEQIGNQLAGSIAAFLEWVTGPFTSKTQMSDIGQSVPTKPTPGGFRGMPGLAGGGLVTQPTKALIGEAGPELVLPLNGRMPRMVGDTLRFATGAGGIVPLSQLGGLGGMASGISNTGEFGAAGDPVQIRMAQNEARQESERYREEIRRENRRLFQQQLELEDRRARDYRTFAGGVRIFGTSASRIFNAAGAFAIAATTGTRYEDLARRLDAFAGMPGYGTGGSLASGLAKTFAPDEYKAMKAQMRETKMAALTGVFGEQAGAVDTLLGGRTGRELAGGHYKKAAYSILGNRAKGQATGQLAGALGKTSIGQAVMGTGVAKQIGAFGGVAAKLARGDLKGAFGSGAQAGVGLALTGALAPALGPFAPLAGSMLAGPTSKFFSGAAKGITGGLGQGLGGARKLLTGDIGGGFKDIGGGVFKTATAPLRGIKKLFGWGRKKPKKKPAGMAKFIGQPISPVGGGAIVSGEGTPGQASGGAVPYTANIGSRGGAGASVLGATTTPAWNNTGGGYSGGVVTRTPVVINLDGRYLAEVVAEHFDEMGRGLG